jgi:transcriptional regulator with XRE-family HTH domain
MTLANKREQTWKSLNDSEYRHQFVEEEINVGIAFQIRSLRNRQKITQVNLAKKLGVDQPLVSSWENPNYGKYSLSTLKEMAKAFDVGLLVRFVPYSKLIDWTIEITKDVIAPPSFKEEQLDRTWESIINNIIVDANNTFASPTITTAPPKQDTNASMTLDVSQLLKYTEGRILINA